MQLVSSILSILRKFVQIYIFVEVEIIQERVAVLFTVYSGSCARVRVSILIFLADDNCMLTFRGLVSRLTLTVVCYIVVLYVWIIRDENCIRRR